MGDWIDECMKDFDYSNPNKIKINDITIINNTILDKLVEDKKELIDDIMIENLEKIKYLEKINHFEKIKYLEKIKLSENIGILKKHEKIDCEKIDLYCYEDLSVDLSCGKNIWIFNEK